MPVLTPTKRQSEEGNNNSFTSPGDDSQVSKRSKVSTQGLDEEYKESDSEEDREDDEGMQIEEDEAEGAATPRRSSSGMPRNINVTGRPAEAGVITRIYCENFMCHRKMTVDMCRNVNFIHGQNGSGKSAILAAVQICLGAGARRTHRARSLKELVRKDSKSSHAKVRVTLLNQGEDAFMPESFPGEVTVERIISKSGTGNEYRLLDRNGKIVTRDKKQLDAMLDQLNIQVENPVAVLDQEEAKKFLTGKAADKYAFFTKATELERMDRAYATSIDHIQELQGQLELAKKALKKDEEVRDQKKAVWDQFQALDKLEKKLGEYTMQLAWAKYNEKAAKLSEEKGTMVDIEKKIEKLTEAIQKGEESLSQNNESEEHKQRLEALTNEASEAAKAKSDLEHSRKEAEAPVRKLRTEINGVKKSIHSAHKNLQYAERNLQETRDEALRKAGSAQSDQARRLQEISRVENEKRSTNSELDEKKGLLQRAHEEYEETEPKLEDIGNEHQRRSSQFSAASRRLNELRNSSGQNSLTIFGNKCAQMAAKVQQMVRSGQFQGEVVGPIGAHMKIEPGKERFAKIAEKAIGGGILDRFICTNHQDRVTLSNMRRQLKCHPRECGIFLSHPGRRYSIPSSPCDSVDLVATVFRIENDLVFNTLVDQCKIELTAVADSKEGSERDLIINRNGREEVRGGKIARVFFLPRGDMWQLRNGTRSMISNDSNKELRQSIGVDRTAAIADAENDTRQVKADLDAITLEFDNAKREVKDVKIRWNKYNQDVKKLSRKLTALNEQHEKLQMEAENVQEETAIDTSELEDDVRMAEESLNEFKAKERELKTELESHSPGLQEIMKKLEEVNARNERVVEEIQACELKLHEVMLGVKHKEAALDKKKDKLQQVSGMREMQAQTIKSTTEDVTEALNKGKLLEYKLLHQSNMAQDQDMSSILDSIEPKITRKPSTYYVARVESAQAGIEEEKRKRRLTNIDKEEAYRQYKQALDLLQSKEQKIDEIEETMRALAQDIRERKRRWKQFRSHIADMTNVGFDDILNKKGSAGQIEFDYKSKELNLVVQKDNTQEMTQTNDVKALSGGERSFTTLALLLALGENLETPFRVMDEFDVFLDPVARKIALKTMVEMAQEMEHRQFIFITPQDLSSLKPGPKLKIHKLKPPVRDNVGGPVQQTLD